MLKLQHKFEKSIVKQQGFTLIELMITVAIVGILAAIAIPSYSIYVLEGKIPDATSNLAAKRVQMEQFYQDNLTYLPSPPSRYPCDTDTNTSKYFIFICSTSATAYTITAKGKDSMDGFEFTIDQSYKKTSVLPAGWSTVSDCWATNNHGGC